MSDKYILDGHEPVPVQDFIEWGKWMETGTRKVAYDEPRPGVRVSTIFLGLDHSFGAGGPVLFETMIFGGPHDEYQERYATWEEAEAGHKAALALASQDSPIEAAVSE